ncbi:MAG: hypothetical protein K6A75_10940 [Ruminococcus sp.]|nr:hypothetical protein [Ruminococcus sp.]
MFDFDEFINTFYDVLPFFPHIFTIILAFSLFSVILRFVRSLLSGNSFFSIPSWFFDSSDSDDDDHDSDYDYDSGYDSSDVIYDPFKKRFLR